MTPNITNSNGAYLLENNNRVFVQSRNINIFPCSRRGQFTDGTLQYYDPEARLNTERTNRLRTAINGFTHSFIDNFTKDKDEQGNELETGTLVFVLAGYYIEVKDFNPSSIAAALGTDTTEIYAHLSLHTGILLNVDSYTTEILYRQSSETTDKNHLDVSYADSATNIADDFFVGISFTKEKITEENGKVDNIALIYHNLKLFSRSDDGYEVEQKSLLPKIEHGETEDSIKVNGDATISGNITISGAAVVNNTITAEKLTITKIDETGAEKGEIKTPQLRVNRITSDEGSITVDNKKLIVNKSLEMLAKEDADNPAEATIENAIIGDLTVKVDSKLKNSTGKITTLNLQATNNATVYDLDVGTNIDTVTLKATTKIDTPTVNVNTVTSTSDTVTVDKNLSVAGQTRTPTLKTNTITSDATEIAIDKQLKVEDNINVGTPTTPATVENGGYIVAKKDITAEQDLVAKRDIKASEKATVKSLVVGERVSSDSVNPGVITAKALVRTPAMEVNTMTTPNTSIVVSKSLQLDKGFSAKDASTATKITANELWLEDVNKTSTGQVPAVELAHLTATNTYQVRLKFGEPITIKEE